MWYSFQVLHCELYCVYLPALPLIYWYLFITIIHHKIPLKYLLVLFCTEESCTLSLKTVPEQTDT